jgi:hypothetical protein
MRAFLKDKKNNDNSSFMHMQEPFDAIEVEEIPELLARPGSFRVGKMDNDPMKSNPFEMIPEEESGFNNQTHRSDEKRLFEESKVVNIFTVDELSVVQKPNIWSPSIMKPGFVSPKNPHISPLRQAMKKHVSSVSYSIKN